MAHSQMPNFDNMQTLIRLNQYRDFLCQLGLEFPSVSPKTEQLATELNDLATEIVATVKASGQVLEMPTTPTVPTEPVVRWNQVKAPK